MESLPIIRTSSGDWVAPRDALVIPPRLQYKGLSLFDKAERNCAERNSGDIDLLPTSEYDVRFLESLGCKVLCKDQVRTVLSSSRVSFPVKEYGWIATLFQYLHENPDADPLTAAYLQLTNDKWIAPQDGGRLYVGDATEVPFEIETVKIALINPKFVDEIFKNEMAKLYLMDGLKAEKLSEVAIINAIFDLHVQRTSLTDPRTGALGKTECHAHALYLTQHQHLIDWDRRSKMDSPFYVVTRNGSIKDARDTVSNRMHSLSKGKLLPISDMSPSSVPFLSPLYPPDVARFLTDRLGVKRLLPLTEPALSANGAPEQNNTATNSDRLHSIFYTVLAPANEKRNFILYYLSIIWTEIPLEIRRGNFLRDLQNLPCLCENGKYIPLRQTTLRTASTSKRLSPSDPVLQIISPEAPKWSFLKELGVVTDPSVHLYMESLRSHSRKKIDGRVNKRFLEEVYAELVAYAQKYPSTALALLR